MPTTTTGSTSRRGRIIVQARQEDSHVIRHQLKEIEENASRDAVIWQRFEDGVRMRNSRYSIWHTLFRWAK